MNRPDPPRFASANLLAVALLLAGGCGVPDDASDGAGAAEAAGAGAISEEEVRARVAEARERLTADEGGRVVLKTIEAHGGLEAWYRAPTSSYTWEYANVDADIRFRSYLVADNRSRRVYHDLLVTGPFDDPESVDARFAWDGSEAWVAPASIERPNPRFWALSGFYFQQIPFVLADPGLHYERLPDEELDGERYEMVRVTFEPDVGDSPGDSYTLYVHPETGRVRAIRYTVSYGRDVEPGADLPETLLYYNDPVTVDGLTVATSFEGYHFTEEEGRGAFKNEAFADSISFRRRFVPSRLEAPENARFLPAPGEGG